MNVAANINANDFTYTGGAGADTLISTSGFAGTDSLTGGDGADTLSIRPAAATGDTTVGALSAAGLAVVSGFETLDMRNSDGAGNMDFTVDMDHLPGVTAITMRAADINNTTEFNISDMTATQGEALSLTMNGTGATVATNAQLDLGLKDSTGTTDKLVVNITTSADDDATPGNNQNITINDVTTNNAIESLTVNLLGSFGAILDTEAAFSTNLTVTGGSADQDLTTATAFANTTVDMSDVASDIVFTSGGTTQTITTGSGGDTITLNAGSKTVDLGAGNDTLLTGGTFGNAVGNVDSLTGGDGTDTLHLEGAPTNTGTVLGQVSGFEVLRLDGNATTALSMANFINNTGFTRIDVDQLGTNTATITNASTSLNSIRLLDNSAGDTLVFSRLVDNATDTLSIDSRTTAARVVTAVTASDEETINLSTNSAAADITITTLTAADLTTLNVSGSGDAVITNAIASATGLATVDATGASGAVTVVGSTSSTAITATGNASSAGVFTFTGGNKGDTITGGGGADVLAGAAGADTILGGAGTDTITGGDGIDTITGGAGADTISFVATLAAASRDTVTDFVTATDIIGLEGAYTTDATGDGLAAVTEDEATAAANATGNAYNLDGLLAATTRTVDLVTLDTAVLTNLANADLTAATDGTELLKALVAAGAGNTATGLTCSNDDDFYIATDDGVNGYLYAVQSGNTLAVAAEITLVATFTGDGDFGDILAANTILI
jgi:S-layer protein